MSDVEAGSKPPKRAALERENAELKARLDMREQELAELRAERPERRQRIALDDMTLADMEALAGRLASAVATLREARPFLGVAPADSGRPDSAPESSHEAPVPARPAPPPVNHPRAKPRLSPEEEGQKRMLLRNMRGEGAPT